MQGRVLFGKYELGRLLGEGNFGKVFKSRSLTTGEIVAIKMINKEQVKKEGLAEQIMREITVMPMVKHPNIVELKEVMATKSNIYLVMEYVGGGDLYTKVRRKGKLDEKLAKKYFLQLIKAVEYCHSRGVVHRDLKLENILLEKNGETLKLADFGLSTMQENEQGNNPYGLLYTPCGAMAYIAPEIIKGDKYDGKKADIWSCGVILYSLLAGFPPFQDENRMRMFWKIRMGKYGFPSHFDKESRDLITRMLATKPSERITIEEIMKSPWLQLETCEYYENYDHGHQLDSESTSGDHGLFCSSPISFNAFDFILSMASGLDLSSMFESHKRSLGTTFVTKFSTMEVMKVVEKMAKRLRYEVRQEKGLRMALIGAKDGRKGGRLVVGVEVFEVSPEVKVVELSKLGGDLVEYVKLMDEEVRPALKDVVWKWQGDWFLGMNSSTR